ncbi:carbohydrate ABC transporter permease [Sinorhizobium sp. CCBAU 05631]|uniref:carbohydrate ABC transporter permease n=1 Tax=Sinorhizobium sp. CCBAU 05631 TaxID=794846 RepID=UPI0004AF7BFE|nr:carbohydrate ABC transporter permease [Sinorhizobium sp. CCBAU 05631]ASY55209.1 Ribose ABC transport system, permease protein RbsC [Sinorhizobium sp. CCBAU 05631]
MTDTFREKLMLAVALVLAAIYLFPLYWMYITALKSGSAMFANPPDFWPTDPQWQIYGQVWHSRNMRRYIWNSLVIAVLPSSLMITPIFVGFSQIGLLDYPRLAVILAIVAKSMPFFIVLVRATFMSVPQELEEAALVDGSSRVGAFFRIVLPLARNGILVGAILIFMQAFGEFVYSKSMIQRIELQPASVGLNSFMGPNTNEWNSIMAYAAIYVTPMLAASVLLQRGIVSGLTAGALK